MSEDHTHTIQSGNGHTHPDPFAPGGPLENHPLAGPIPLPAASLLMRLLLRRLVLRGV